MDNHNSTLDRSWGNFSGFNMSGPSWDDFENPFDFLHVRVIFSILYGLVFLACFIGNLLVIVVILKHRKMRTITNFFLANLAAADFCVGIFCILQKLYQTFSTVWVLGRVLCKLYYSVQAAAYIASIIILVVISAERYFAILHPLRSKQLTTLFLQRIVVITIWLVSILSSIPFLLFYDAVAPSEDSDIRFCVRVYSKFNNTAYVLVNFVLWYLVPLIVLTYMYARISIVLWNTSRPDKLTASTRNSAISSNGNVNGKSEQSRKGFKPKRLQIKLAYLTAGRISLTGRQNPGSKGNTSSTDYEHCNTMSDIEMQSLERTECQVVVTCDTDDDDDTFDSCVADGRDYTYQEKAQQHSPQLHQGGAAAAAEKHSPSGRGGHNSLNQVPVSSVIRSGSGGVKAVRFREKSSDKAMNALVARRRVIRLLIAVVLAFAICVLPSHLYQLWTLFGHVDYMTSTTFHKILPAVTYLILYSNSALNPLLYAFLSDNFRKSLKDLLGGLKKDPPMMRTNMRSTVSGGKTANTMI